MSPLNQIQEVDLGFEPHAKCHLNGQAHQQELVQTYQGMIESFHVYILNLTKQGTQYILLFKDAPGGTGIRHLCLGKRRLGDSSFMWIEFSDYEQTTDDCHNVCDLDKSTLRSRWTQEFRFLRSVCAQLMVRFTFLSIYTMTRWFIESPRRD
jgi:hypothetical protein